MKMAQKTLAPPRPQSIPPADRCGYRPLAAPHGSVEFKIYAHWRWTMKRPEPDLRLFVEYRGTERNLIAAGIVTRNFLAPRPGRKRIDAAGRRISLKRRLGGIRVVTFSGDLFQERRLPAITRELVDEAIEERRRYDGEREPTQAPDPTSSVHYRLGLALGRLSGIADDDATAEEFIALLPAVEAKLLARKSKRGIERKRPGFLRLVVDNDNAVRS
jgi:hypothetical protein